MCENELPIWLPTFQVRNTGHCRVFLSFLTSRSFSLPSLPPAKRTRRKLSQRGPETKKRPQRYFCAILSPESVYVTTRVVLCSPKYCNWFVV